MFTLKFTSGIVRNSTIWWKAALITVQDGHPANLSWIGATTGRRVYPLGLTEFGQSGNLPDLFRTYKIDADAIIQMAARASIDLASPR